jgi:multidrug resistance efflux pump
MIRKYVLPFIAAAGLLLAVFVVLQGSKPVPAAQPVTQPAPAPYPSYVAGAGLVEAATENIAIGTGVGGTVTEVFVKAGDKVNKGDPLFRVRDKTLRAELAMQQAAARTATAQLEKLKAYVRQEDVDAAKARVAEAEAVLADARNALALYESVPDKRAIVQEELTRRRYAVAGNQARADAARAELARLQAGAWKPDLEVAQAQVDAAEAQVAVTEAELDRHTIKAPTAATILQVKIRPGEYAMAGVPQTPLMVLGDVDTLHVRVDVGENDAWRLNAGAPATAYVRGNRDLHAPLKFVRVEPYVIPKKSLTGESTERVDTRVLQALYSFDRAALPVYVGQQMDVFVEAPPVEAATASNPAARAFTTTAEAR